MAKTTDNLFPFDMSQFDMSKFMPGFDAKMFDPANFKVPGFDASAFGGADVEAVMSAQRKNAEALADANRKAIAGMQDLANRQGEILKEALDVATKGAAEVVQSGNPQDAAVKQTELYKQAFETALSNMRELADMSTKANAEVTDAINTRVSESLDELKEQVLKLKA